MLKLNLLLFALAIVFGSALAAAQAGQSQPNISGPQLMYQGDLKAKSSHLSVALGETASTASVRYELANISDRAVRHDLAIREHRAALPKRLEPLAIESRAVGQVLQTLQYPTTGRELKEVRVDPRLEVGGKELLSRFESMRIDVKLPAGVTQLVYSSLPGGTMTVDPSDGRTVLTYQLVNQYPVPLTLKWNTGAQIRVTKVGSLAGLVLSVDVTVKNEGREAVRDIQVNDDFHPAFVSSGTPKNEFELVRGTVNDQRLIWKHRVEVLGSGESINLKYEVTFRNAPPKGLKLGRTTVTRSGTGELVGASTPLTVVPE